MQVGARWWCTRAETLNFMRCRENEVRHLHSQPSGCSRTREKSATRWKRARCQKKSLQVWIARKSLRPPFSFESLRATKKNWERFVYSGKGKLWRRRRSEERRVGKECRSRW